MPPCARADDFGAADMPYPMTGPKVVARVGIGGFVLPDRWLCCTGLHGVACGCTAISRWVRFSPARFRGHAGTSGDIAGHFARSRGDIWGHPSRNRKRSEHSGAFTCVRMLDAALRSLRAWGRILNRRGSRVLYLFWRAALLSRRKRSAQRMNREGDAETGKLIFGSQILWSARAALLSRQKRSARAGHAMHAEDPGIHCSHSSHVVPGVGEG